MTDQILVAVLAFAVLAAVVMLLAWWWARRLKRTVDEAPVPTYGSHDSLDMDPLSVEQLRGLTREPILLKQSQEGVRVQIERSPMLPLIAFAGRQGYGAITEAAAAITRRYGVTWVVLVTPVDDAHVSIARLA